MKSHKAELVRLFILVNLLVLALFTIPAHAPEHNAVQQKVSNLQSNYIAVTNAQRTGQPQDTF